MMASDNHEITKAAGVARRRCLSPIQGRLGFVLFLHLAENKDVENLENSERVYNQQGYKPPLFFPVCGFPKRNALPRQ